MCFYRRRPWRYSVIPSTPDIPTKYQICRNSNCNPAGLPVFAAIWGPDFRTGTIILTHMFKQIKQTRITSMTRFKVNPGPPNKVPGALLICMQRSGTRVTVALFILRLASYLVLHALKVGVLGLPNLVIAMKSSVSFPKELKLERQDIWKTEASETIFCSFTCVWKMCMATLGDLL